jgi:segregation and condensation protein B
MDELENSKPGEGSEPEHDQHAPASLEPAGEPLASDAARIEVDSTVECEAAPEAESATDDEPAIVDDSAPEVESTPEDEAEPAISVDELMLSAEQMAIQAPQEDQQLKAVLEAVIYVAEEPLTVGQLAASLQQPSERIAALMEELIAEFDKPGHGLCVREIAGGYKMATKPEHHDAVRNFVKSLKPPLKLSLPALETLAVIAYKQPVTGPEVLDIRGVQGGGVMKTLLDRKLIAVAGRKNVIGKPILYKTTKEFLIQFGLKDLSELPSLKEFEEIRRMAFETDAPVPEAVPSTEAAPPAEAVPPTEAAPPAETASEPDPPSDASEESNG